MGDMTSREGATLAQVTPLSLEKKQFTTTKCSEVVKSVDSGSENNNNLLETTTDSDESQGLDSSVSWEEVLSPSTTTTITTMEGSTQLLAPGTPTYIAKDANSLTFQWECSKPASASASVSVSPVPLYVIEMQQVEVPSGALTPDNGLARTLVDPAHWEMVYSGTECWTQVKQLRPGCYYAVRVRCDWTLKNEVVTVLSSITVFHTTQTIPAAPQPPALIGIKETSLHLDWVDPVQDGGSEITGFRLQLKEGPSNSDKDFSDVYNGLARSFNVENLEPYTKYTARIKAINEVGEGPWSLCSCFRTKGKVPDAPRNFSGSPFSPTSLRLSWSSEKQRGKIPNLYEIEVEDLAESWCYYIKTGTETECQVIELKCEIEYQFRVRCNNEIGNGEWSKSIKLRLEGIPPTVPSCPFLISCFSKDIVIGWHPPLDSGGLPIIEYMVEMMRLTPLPSLSTSNPVSDGEGNDISKRSVDPMHKSWRIIYQGCSCDCPVKDLYTGCDYHIRAKARNQSGWSLPSLTLHFQTPRGVPEKPFSPCAISKSDASILLKWKPPIHDGGLKVNFYILEFCFQKQIKSGRDPKDENGNEDTTLAVIEQNLPFVEVYKGWKTQTEVKNLEAGKRYGFRVKAVNQLGGSDWSNVSYDMIVMSTDESDLPLPPRNLQITAIRDQNIYLKWAPATISGKSRIPIVISAYTLALAKLDSSLQDRLPQSILPNSTIIGDSDGVPRLTKLDELDVEEVDKEVKKLDFVELYDGALPECVLKSLESSTSYLIKAKAQSKMGMSSSWSDLYLLQMDIMQPKEALSDLKVDEIHATKLKLSWKDLRALEENRLGQFVVEMESSDKQEAQWAQVWAGNNNFCFIDGLSPGKNFNFRVFEESQGSCFGENISVLTECAAPCQPQEVKVSQVTAFNIKLEWIPVKQDNGTPVTYYHIQLQEQSFLNDDNDCQVISETVAAHNKMLKIGNLKANQQYEVKLLAENEIGLSEWSCGVKVKTKLAPPLPPSDIHYSLTEMDGYNHAGIRVEWKNATMMTTNAPQLKLDCHKAQTFELDLQQLFQSTKKLNTSSSNSSSTSSNRSNGQQQQQQSMTKTSVTDKTSYLYPSLEKNGKYELRIRSVSESGISGRWSKAIIIDVSIMCLTEEKSKQKEQSEQLKDDSIPSSRLPLSYEAKRTDEPTEDIDKQVVGVDSSVIPQIRRGRKGQVAVPLKRTNPVKRRKTCWKMLKPYRSMIIILFVILLVSILTIFCSAY